MMTLFGSRQAQRGFLLNPYRFGTAQSLAGFSVVAGGNAYSAVAEKYTHATEVTTSLTNLQQAREGAAGASGTSYGLIACGYNGGRVDTTDKYDHATSTQANGTALGQARRYSAAVSTTTTFIGAGGDANQTCRKYVYSSDSVSNGTNVASTQLWAACGNSTKGVFAGGFSGLNLSWKYTYSGDAVASGATLSSGRYGLSATASPAVGVYAGGHNNIAGKVTDRYAFSADTTSSHSGITTEFQGAPQNCGTYTTGFFPSANTSGATNTVRKYIFASSAWASGTNITTAKSYAAGFSSVPGGL